MHAMNRIHHLSGVPSTHARLAVLKELENVNKYKPFRGDAHVGVCTGPVARQQQHVRQSPLKLCGH